MAIRTFLHFVCQFQSKCTKFYLRRLIIQINMLPIVVSHQNKKMTSLKRRLICKYHICMRFVHLFFITPGRRQLKTPILSRNVDRNSLDTVFRLPFVAPLATNCNRKHRLYQFLIRVRRLLITFLIAAYPVCLLA